MILLPITVYEKNGGWFDLGLFLCDGGHALWSIDDSMTDKEITEMLLENGFPVSKLVHHENLVIAAIDSTRLRVEHFYLWAELDPDNASEDCWRFISIPTSLWSDPVFQSYLWKEVGYPELSEGVKATVSI